MVHGYLGAGKTTFAWPLEQRLPALRLSHDEWMVGLYGADPPAERFPLLFDRVSRLIEFVWTRCAKLGVDVVLDQGFWSRRERDALRSKAAGLGAGVRLYNVTCPDDVAWERIERRNRDLTDSLFIARDTFILLRERFEPLDEDEARIEVSG